MVPVDIISLWSSDPLAGMLVFGSGALLICALLAAVVGTMLAGLRDGGSASAHDVRNDHVTAAFACERDAA